jgi:hypothetical protein
MKSTALRALLFGSILTLVLLTNPHPGRAGGDDDSLKLIGAIPNPGPNPLAADISYVDQRRERFYLADVSNKAVDVFDAEHGSLLGQITGNFHGFPTPTEIALCGVPGFDARGPSGQLVANDNRLWVTDYTGGNGTVKVFDLEGAEPPFSTLTPSTTITFGQSQCRADELSFDPNDHIVLVGFPETETGGTPFVAFISSDPPYKILGTLQFPGAGGIEQSVWDPKSHRFLLNVPGVGIAVIKPKDLDDAEKIYPTGCAGTGLALGPLRHLLVGCGDKPDMILDADNGTILTTFLASEAANSDEVWFNQGDDHFYATSNFRSALPSLAVIDAESDTFLQDVPTSLISHSVAAFRENNHVFVPILWVPTTPDVCNTTFGLAPGKGCIFVFADENDEGADGK